MKVPMIVGNDELAKSYSAQENTVLRDVPLKDSGDLCMTVGGYPAGASAAAMPFFSLTRVISTNPAAKKTMMVAIPAR